jgi:predicted RNA-binding Zn-ribbon protein involved in translation (DUF1610 family)
MKRKSPIRIARDIAQSDLQGKTLVRVNYAALAKNKPLYQDAMFYLKAGWYRDYPFNCADCGKLEIWKATQQKWWYEVAKGGILTVAKRCRACRKVFREKRTDHQNSTLAGHEKKR